MVHRLLDLVGRLRVILDPWPACLRDRKRWDEREKSALWAQARGKARLRFGTPSASVICLPRPSPYGSSLSRRPGITSDSTLITNEDTLFLLHVHVSVWFALCGLVLVVIFKSLCMAMLMRAGHRLFPRPFLKSYSTSAANPCIGIGAWPWYAIWYP